MLHVESDFIHDSLDDVDGEGKEITINLLNEINIDEEYEREYISSESEGEGDINSDFDDTNTSLVIDALKLIEYLVLIMIYINMAVISNN